MDKDLRVSLVAAGAAALLSALIGVIAGVAFLALFFRALLGGLLFGGAVYGCILLLRKNLPGLFEAKGDESGAQGQAMGAGVDIVLPEEAVSAEAYSPIDSAAGFDESPSPRRRATAGEGEEEAAELAPLDEDSLLEPERPQRTESTRESAAREASGRDRGPSSGFEDLDVLPDLEGFSDAFTSAEFSSSRDGTQGNGDETNYHKNSGSRSGQEGLDPAALAQAVRTILKRDQKG